MGKYYNGPTVDDIKNCDKDIDEWRKKFAAEMISYYIRRTVMEFRVYKQTNISIPNILFWGYNICNKDDLDWLTKELEEAGFKVTIEKEEEKDPDDDIPSIVDGTYTISWDKEVLNNG